MAIAIITGCSSTPQDGLGTPAKFIKRVQFVPYDSIVRQPNPNLVVLDEAPTDKKFKVIAQMTCEGAYHEEVVMTEAMIYEAKKLGADAMVRLPPIQASTGHGTALGFDHGTRCLFRANAIVFEKP